MAWRMARSLDVCMTEIRSVWPDAVIGTVGDVRHQAGTSDHNPEDDDNDPDTPEVVCAIDPMDGPGVDIDELVRRVLRKPHPDLTYVIRKGKIYHRRNGFRPTTYRGKDKHTNHAHLSVGGGSDGHRQPPFDDLDPWGIAAPDTAEEDMGFYLVKFAGAATVYAAPGEVINGKPALVPLTNWPRCQQWMAGGVRYVEAPVKIDPTSWTITEPNTWPEAEVSIDAGHVDLSELITKLDALAAAVAGMRAGTFTLGK